MKIAIHDRPGSYSEKWIDYCQNNKINYKVVDCEQGDIINELIGCNALLWHWSHIDYSSKMSAQNIITALEKIGVFVYPNSATCWHFDDKVAQKYLLEAVGAPHARGYVFYNKKKALEWAENSRYPVVFKLKSGSSSQNVKLIINHKQAKNIINKAFDKGFDSFPDYFADKKAKIEKTQINKDIRATVRRIYKVMKNLRQLKRMHGKQIGYVYFQEYLPNNKYDIRVTIIGGRAFCHRRFNRSNDFRASGSGMIDYSPKDIDTNAIRIAFDTSNKIKSQSMAYDFAYDYGGSLKIIEMSYAAGKPINRCPGYWDTNLIWHNREKDVENYIIEDLISTINNNT
jgi:glutathione synthase/RimK-type ligase-like ATP-grasp enzyme